MPGLFGRAILRGAVGTLRARFDAITSGPSLSVRQSAPIYTPAPNRRGKYPVSANSQPAHSLASGDSQLSSSRNHSMGSGDSGLSDALGCGDPMGGAGELPIEYEKRSGPNDP